MVIVAWQLSFSVSRQRAVNPAARARAERCKYHERSYFNFSCLSLVEVGSLMSLDSTNRSKLQFLSFFSGHIIPLSLCPIISHGMYGTPQPNTFTNTLWAIHYLRWRGSHKPRRQALLFSSLPFSSLIFPFLCATGRMRRVVT